MAALGLLMAEGSRLRVNSDKWEGAATAQKLCAGAAQVSSSLARRGRSEAVTELLRRVNGCLILDQFGALITCPIQQGDGALSRSPSSPRSWRGRHLLSLPY